MRRLSFPNVSAVISVIAIPVLGNFPIQAIQWHHLKPIDFQLFYAGRFFFLGLHCTVHVTR